MKTTDVDQDVLSILDRQVEIGCVSGHNFVKLTSGQLYRKMYLKVDAVLEAIGGRWDRKAAAHLFPEDPAPLIENVLLTGTVARPSKNGYFPTPKHIVMKLIELAEIKPFMLCLEPSAGQGAISDVLYAIMHCNVHMVELLPANREILVRTHYGVLMDEPDFMQFNRDRDRLYDRVVMNPPFENQQDIDHVRHAFEMLRPGGILVSVMSKGITFRQRKKTRGRPRDRETRLGGVSTRGCKRHV